MSDRVIGLVVVAAAGLGCQRLVDEPLEACGGMLGATPTQLASSSTSNPVVFVDGDTLLLVEPGQAGHLRRLDRCSGVELDAIEVPFLAQAILHEGEVVMTGVSEGPNPYLMRWDAAADALVMLGEVSFSRLFSHSTGIYLVDDAEIRRFDEVGGSAVLVHVIDVPADNPNALALVGIHEAGIYYRLDYDTGSVPLLMRWSIDADAVTSVEGSAGATTLAAVGDRIVIPVDHNPGGFGAGVRDIVAIPATGGEPTLLYEGSSEDPWHITLAADDTWVCWTGARVRCVASAEPGLVHELSSPGAVRQVALGQDAVYWWASVEGEQRLMAAAL